MKTARTDVVSIRAGLPKPKPVLEVQPLANGILPQSAETTRRCNKCAESQPLTEFCIRSDRPHLRRRRCRTCQRRSPDQKKRQNELRALCPERDTLRRMVQRCHNPRNPRYSAWGGRGISVCGAWRGKGAFDRFLAHIGRRPTTAHSIDRYPNQDGNYEPGNVRWATRVEQMNNIHNNVRITAQGATRTLTEWQVVTGIDRETLDSRYRRGWSEDEIINVPLGPAYTLRRYRKAKQHEA